jgi:CheY-like chemotaxis protein
MMKLVLEDEGFAVTIARDGAEALALVGSMNPDVLLLDLRLPVLNGEEVASKIRGLPDGARPKVLVISASSRLKEISEQIGADGFVQKPFELDDLIAATQQAFAK